MSKRIVIFSPHTDDGELGCGGSIIKWLDEGNFIYWVVFSIAEDSLPDGMPKDTLEKEFLGVVNHLGLPSDQIEILKYPVRYLFEHRQSILEKMVSINRTIKPDLVIGPSLHDLHQDHIVVANEMVRAFKASSSIISYELPWNHVTFNTQMFVPLTKNHMAKKFQLLQFYESQTKKNRNYFSDEFIFGLSKARGIQINQEYAEAFEVIRWIM